MSKKIILSALLLQIICTINVQTKEIAMQVVSSSTSQKVFGGWSIDLELFNFIREILPEGSTILEFGSGWASAQLSKHYTVYSIEHNRRWLHKYKTNYIFAPIKNHWYDIDVLQEKLPQEYDLIIVDGPPENIGRGGFFIHLDMFKTDIPIIFDDINRKNDYDNMVNVAEKLDRDFTIHQSSKGKQFGVILPH